LRATKDVGIATAGWDLYIKEPAKHYYYQILDGDKKNTGAQLKYEFGKYVKS
jgi:hypothetical protein